MPIFAWMVPGFLLAAAALHAFGGCSDEDTSSSSTSGGDGGGDGGVKVVLDGGGDIPEPPDGVAACPAGACNYQSGEGCSGATPSCLPAADSTGAIVPSCQG